MVSSFLKTSNDREYLIKFELLIGQTSLTFLSAENFSASTGRVSAFNSLKNGGIKAGGVYMDSSACKWRCSLFFVPIMQKFFIFKIKLTKFYCMRI